MYVVIKRDGRQVQFDASKIEIAIISSQWNIPLCVPTQIELLSIEYGCFNTFIIISPLWFIILQYQLDIYNKKIANKIEKMYNL